MWCCHGIVFSNIPPSELHTDTKERSRNEKRQTMTLPMTKRPRCFAIALMLMGIVLAYPAVAQTRSSSYCDSYARQNGGSGGALAEAARGAIGGAIVGGIFNSKKGARRGSKVGGVAGALTEGSKQNIRYQELYSRCMNGNPL